MRVTFMGTPDFAVPSLRLLAKAHDVTLVVTRPDAVRTRGTRLEPSPVKAAALELGIPVVEAARVTPEVLERVRAERPEVIAVAAFGCVLPDALLELPPLGCVNVHGSLLPRWRGAAPIQRAVLSGDERVGVSIMRVVHDLDAGAYCRQASVEVGETPCAALMGRLADLGAQELVAALADMAAGVAVWTEQDASLVTYAAKVEKAEMLLRPGDPASSNLRRVQASLDGSPARLLVAGKGVRVTAARAGGGKAGPGELRVGKRAVLLGCADGTLELVRVKPDGRREMDAAAWAAGLRAKALPWAEA